MTPNPVTVGIKWSQHALERWNERFPSLDREAVFGQSVAASTKIRTKIRKQCTAHKNTLTDWFLTYKGALFNREHKIAFIIGMHPEIDHGERTVVTVFPIT